MNKPRKHIRESEDAYIKRASMLYYNSGYTILEIADRLKISKIRAYNAVVDPMYRITTEEEREEMIHMRDAGYSIDKIAKITGKGRSCVKRRLATPATLDLGNTGPILTDKQIENIKKMYKSGKTVDEIATATGCSSHSIIWRLTKCGIYKRVRTFVSKEEIEKMRKLRSEGHTVKEICKTMNRGESTVVKYTKK